MEYNLIKKLDDFNAALVNLHKSLRRFLSIYISVEQMSASAHLYKDRVTGLVNLDRQTLHDPLVKKFEVLMKMNVLFTMKTDDQYKTVLFNKPYEGQMFVIHILTQPFGIVSQFHFVLFDSLEVMYKYLNDQVEIADKTIDKEFVKPVDYPNLVRLIC